MTPEQFAFWLHGYFEISCSDVLSEAQVRKIKENLESCFNKVTPRRSILDLPAPPASILGNRIDSDGYEVFNQDFIEPKIAPNSLRIC